MGGSQGLAQRENACYLFMLIVFITLSVVLLFIWFKRKSIVALSLALLLDGFVFVLVDRCTAKEYRRFLLSQQEQLGKTISFLHSTLPDIDLYNIEQINMLIQRLTGRIEAKVPFKNFLSGLANFAKGIVLPVVTYIAGIYSKSLENVSIDTVAVDGLVIILLLGLACLVWNFFSAFIRTILCRDYDAAVSFREDLLDIKLLYFSAAAETPEQARI